MRHTQFFLAFLAVAFTTCSMFTSCKDEKNDPVIAELDFENPEPQNNFFMCGGIEIPIFATMYGLKDTTGINTDSLRYYYNNPEAVGIPTDNIVYVGKLYHHYKNNEGTVTIYKQTADGSWSKVAYPSQEGPSNWEFGGTYIVYEENNEKLFLIRSVYGIDSADASAISELNTQE